MNTNPNDMQANPNDDEAKLTAYVLGELAPEEVATLEATIARDADLRREVEAIRSTTDQLSAAFAAEPSPGLTPAQRTAISAGAAPADEPPVIFSFRRWAGIGLAAAACLAVVALIPVVMQNRANDESFAVLSQASPNDAVTEVTAEADVGAEAFQDAGRKRLEAMTQEQSITPGAVAGSTRERGSAGGETVRDELERNTPGFGVI
ncbi:MAG: hypothetical protein HKO59_05475, partial [Phycisphaerales bacterium]|nr:hypothetical protein [Phycisphaerales bacterium]